MSSSSSTQQLSLASLLGPAADLVPGQVPLDELELELGEFKNPRVSTGLLDSDIAELAASIRTDGLQKRISVAKWQIGQPAVTHFVVKDGQRRVRALRHLAAEGLVPATLMVPVLFTEGGVAKPLDRVVAVTAIGEAVAIGVHQMGLSTYEVIRAAATLAQQGYKQSEISIKIKRSEAWVSRMLKAWNHATEDLRESLRKGTITDEQFKELAVVKAPEQPEAVKEIENLREKGDRRAAREASKEKAAKELPPPKPRKAPTAPLPLDGPARRDPMLERAGASIPAPVAVPPRAIDKGDLTTAEILGLVKVIAPLDQYTRGVVDLCRVTQGQLEMTKLGKPFRLWLDRVKRKMNEKAKTTKPSKAERTGMVKAAAEGKAKAKIKAPAPKASSSGTLSKACKARHHGRCVDKGCRCTCHGGK